MIFAFNSGRIVSTAGRGSLYLFGALLFCVFGLTPFNSCAVSTTNTIEYNRDIRPILVENCFSCHGPDSAARKASLRLDRFADATALRKDNEAAIVPGKPGASLMVHRIFETNADDIMPPAKTEKILTPQQKDLLRRWIASGAKYQPLWSFIAPQKPELPKVKDRRWVRNPIDAFILARLEEKGLKPAHEADKRTLIRRVSLDLTGLPPTIAEVENFVNDKSPGAYEKVVDRLLASPHYGEHRARYWLDAARYADSNGIHFDNYREMWSYREWVINAFNRNESFAQFTIDQLAGDLVPHHTLEQEIGSGFNRCNITSNEGGAIDEEYLVLYARDRTEATSQVWLGLTAGCAVCHDHKYDPLPQKQFYALTAFFNNTTQKAMDGNIQNTPPTIVVPTMADRPRWDAIADEKKQLEHRVSERAEGGRKDFEVWMTNNPAKAFARTAPKDKPLFRAVLSDNRPEIKYVLDGETNSVNVTSNVTWKGGILSAKAYVVDKRTLPTIPDAGDFDTAEAFSYGAWVYLDKAVDGALMSRMDDTNNFRGWDLWLEGGKPGTHIVSKWPDDALKIVANNPIPMKKWTHVCITYDGSAKTSGVKIYVDGIAQAATVQADKLKGSIATSVPFRIGQRNTTSPLEGAWVQDARIYDRVLKPEEVTAIGPDTLLVYLMKGPGDKLNSRLQAKEKEQVYQIYLRRFDPEYMAATAAAAPLEKEVEVIKSHGTEALVMNEKTNAPIAYVLNRGEYDQRRDQVTADTPTALPPMSPDFPKNRLGFAEWLLLPENPLTSRVTVNRFWQEIFGTGIVKTAGDFGVTGEMPSNQRLLDWLAVDFRESNWDIKRIIKLMVMSSAYRQSAAVTPDKLAKDPDNRFVSRGPRFRMDAEMVRDYALSASGLLVPKIGGPSVKTYQPPGVWEAVAMIGSNTRNYVQDTGDKLYRRSLYTFWKRAAPPASMEIFNAPSRETCTVRRERGDTPLQALVTMDDPQFVEAARNLAQLTLEQGGQTDQQRLDFMAERLLARPFTPEERKINEAVLKKLLAHYQADPKDATALIAVGESKADVKLDQPTLAAYAMVANELFNMDEVLNK